MNKLESPALAAWRANPFFVLEIKPDASRADVERVGQRLLAQLSIGAQGAAEYATPLGKGTRDADMVRQALASLRDPAQRQVHELWAAMTPPALSNASKPATNFMPDTAPKWDHAESWLGWAKQCL